MENFAFQESPDPITFDTSCIKQLDKTRKWTKFLSIVGFTFLALISIVSILAILFTSRNSGGFLPGLAIAPAVLLVFVYFPPLYFLNKFSSHSKAAIDNSSGQSLAAALRYLKLHYTFMGILVIVVLTFYLIAAIVFFSTSRGFHMSGF